MKNTFSIISLFVIGIILALGCSETKKDAPANTANVEPPISVSAKVLTKEYEENELSADGKYKNKSLIVSGKISNIAETFGNITVQLEGHSLTSSVMCGFDESEKANVMKLKKGQSVTFIGKGDGSTGGLYVGLQSCKIQ